jgi:hypothetical protein
VNKQRSAICRIYKRLCFKKTKSTIEFLGCTSQFFKDFLTSKMTEGMTLENTHVDHIKPVAAFDLSDPEQMADCCHYSNFQPLFSADNQSKSSKWNDEAELFWRENISRKDYRVIYNPFAVYCVEITKKPPSV